MHFRPTKKGLPKSPNLYKFPQKVILGLFLLIFLTGYQPTQSYPFIKQSIIEAQETNEQTHHILAQNLPFNFQVLFPGYLSQHFSSWHKALDIATGLGMPIKPITGGTVISSGYDWFGYGLKVEIDHGQGYRSLYAHLGKIYVKEGQKIDANSYIGEVGLTGRTTGPHTHLEVQKDSEYIDPETLLPQIREYATEEDFKPVGGKGFSFNEQKKDLDPASTQRPEVPEWVLKPAVKKPASIVNSTSALEKMLNLNNPDPVKSDQLDFIEKFKLN